MIRSLNTFTHSLTVNMDEGYFTVTFTVRVVGNGRNDGFCFVGDELNFIREIGNAYGNSHFASLSLDAANAVDIYYVLLFTLIDLHFQILQDLMPS